MRPRFWKAAGISAMVVSMHTVKPLDEHLLRDVLGHYAVVAVVEEHSRIGGLGSAIAEWSQAQPGRARAAGLVRHSRRLPARIGLAGIPCGSGSG